MLEAIKILELSVKNDIKFQEFRELEIQLRAAKNSDSVTLASDEVELVKSFIVSEISSDPLRSDLDRSYRGVRYSKKCDFRR